MKVVFIVCYAIGALLAVLGMVMLAVNETVLSTRVSDARSLNYPSATYTFYLNNEIVPQTMTDDEPAASTLTYFLLGDTSGGLSVNSVTGEMSGPAILSVGETTELTVGGMDDQTGNVTDLIGYWNFESGLPLTSVNPTLWSSSSTEDSDVVYGIGRFGNYGIRGTTRTYSPDSSIVPDYSDASWNSSTYISIESFVRFDDTDSPSYGGCNIGSTLAYGGGIVTKNASFGDSLFISSTTHGVILFACATTPNTWHHVGYTMRNTSGTTWEFRFYLDGVEQSYAFYSDPGTTIDPSVTPFQFDIGLASLPIESMQALATNCTTDEVGIFVGADLSPSWPRIASIDATSYDALSVAVDATCEAATISYSLSYVCYTGQVTSIVPVIDWSLVGTEEFAVSPSIPAGLVINALTGEVSGTPEAVTASAVYTVTMPASNVTHMSIDAEDSFMLEVRAYPTLSYSPPGLYATNEVVSLSPVTLNVTGTLSWVIEPDLPAGVLLNGSTGEISGTATSSDERSYVVSVSGVDDLAADIISASFTLSFGREGSLIYPVTRITTDRSITVTPTTTYTLPDPAVSFSISPALPVDIVAAIDPATGVISIDASGDDTYAIVADYVVTLADTGGDGASAGFGLIIDAIPGDTLYEGAAVYPNGVQTMVFGEKFEMTPGIQGDLLFRMDDVAGVTIDADTGVVSGTVSGDPTTTAQYMEITVKSGSVNQRLSIAYVVVDRITYSSTTVTADLGTAININVVSSGHSALESYTSYTVSPSLPLGVTLRESDGTISGTVLNWPADQGLTAPYTVTASGAGDTTAQANLTLVRSTDLEPAGAGSTKAVSLTVAGAATAGVGVGVVMATGLAHWMSG